MFGKIIVTNCSTIILQPNWILKLISSIFENMEKLVFSKLPVSQLKFIFDSWAKPCSHYLLLLYSIQCLQWRNSAGVHRHMQIIIIFEISTMVKKIL